MGKNRSSPLGILQWMTMVIGLSWFEIIGEFWKLGRKVMRGLSNEGINEVLDYETTLELHDRKGNRATLKF